MSFRYKYANESGIFQVLEFNSYCESISKKMLAIDGDGNLSGADDAPQPLHVIQQLLLLCYYAGEIEAEAWEKYLQHHPVLVAYCQEIKNTATHSSSTQSAVPGSCS